MFHKYFVFAFLLFGTGTIARAYPAIGDKVEWTGTIDSLDGTSTNVKVVKEVLSHDKGKWTVRRDVTVNGKTTTENLSEDALYTPDQYKETLASCVTKGGKIEKITVPAGTYNACMLTTVTEDGKMEQKWWGDVPFGVVRKNTTDGGKDAQAKLDLPSIIKGL